MPRKRQLRPDAEVVLSGQIQPVLLNGGQTIKTLSAAFLADLEAHWRTHGTKILDVLAQITPINSLPGVRHISLWNDDFHTIASDDRGFTMSLG